MFYPRNIAEKLSFNQVVDSCIAFCDSDRGKQHFHKLKVSDDASKIATRLNQTEELRNIVSNGQLSFSLPIDLDLQMDQAKVKGFYYELDTIAEIKDLLFTGFRVMEFAEKQNGEYPLLYRLFRNIAIDPGILQAIDKVVGPENEIRPTASVKLQGIIREITRSERAIIRSSNSIFSKAKEQGFLAETELGIKNGRVVLPVLSEHKRKVNGVLIDQSGTGKISYIEPLELVQINNELAELQIQKRQEVVRILKELTARIAAELPHINRSVEQLSLLDFIRAKARLAVTWNMVLPKLGKETEVYAAEHPILKERLKAENKKIVPLNYTLNSDQRLLVISGPNAGGKSVALKTVGLLQYMLQCGLLVPCLHTSTFRVFENIFIDIGDDQSIESDLSTYSSHLKSAKHIINFCNSDTLVLMDEIGTGTDPMFGGPMAEAILEEIHAKKAYGVITTHFSNIKTKTKKLQYAVNAAMLFDVDSLSPLYRLEVGQPGSSFVYEVAANIGMNKKLIKRAKQLTHTKQYDLDVLLAEVQTQRDALDEQLKELKEREANAAHFEKEYRKLKQELDQRKKEILQQAKQEASTIIQGANKDIERTIREIKETKADKVKTHSARKKLEAQQQTVETPKEEAVIDIKVGDRVQIIDTTSIGEVVEIKKKIAVVQIGNMTTKTKLNKLEKVGRKTARKVKQYISTASYYDKQTSFSAEKDVRGMRTVDALSAIDVWIDTAIILGMNSLRLVHGKGNGILRKEIRKHLKHTDAISSIEYEHIERGGEGVSIIELK